jgi:hypothetical protein
MCCFEDEHHQAHATFTMMLSFNIFVGCVNQLQYRFTVVANINLKILEKSNKNFTAWQFEACSQKNLLKMNYQDFNH